MNFLLGLTAQGAGAVLFAVLTSFIMLSVTLGIEPAAANESRCRAPNAIVEPLPGGMAQVNVLAPCKQGGYAVIKYGDIVHIGKLDKTGRWQFVLDAFQGEDKLEISFGDKFRLMRRLRLPSIKSMTKVAVVWQDNVDLDLHAFEYSAPQQSQDHLSSANRGSFDKVQQRVVQAGMSRGFISSASEGASLGYNVEVYTLLHHPSQKRGVIRLAVDYVTRGNLPKGTYCGDGHNATVRFSIYVLEPGATVKRFDRVLQSLPCGVRLDPGQRIISKLVPDLVLRSAQ